MDLGPILLGVFRELQPLLIIAIATIALVEFWATLRQWRALLSFEALCAVFAAGWPWIVQTWDDFAHDDDARLRPHLDPGRGIESFVLRHFSIQRRDGSYDPRRMSAVRPDDAARAIIDEHDWVRGRPGQAKRAPDRASREAKAWETSLARLKEIAALCAEQPGAPSITIDPATVRSLADVSSEAEETLRTHLARDIAGAVGAAEAAYRRRTWLYSLAIATLLALVAGTALPGLDATDRLRLQRDVAAQALSRHVEVLGAERAGALLLTAYRNGYQPPTEDELLSIAVRGYDVRFAEAFAVPPGAPADAPPAPAPADPDEEVEVGSQLAYLLHASYFGSDLTRLDEAEYRMRLGPRRFAAFILFEAVSALTVGFVVALLARAWFARPPAAPARGKA